MIESISLIPLVLAIAIYMGINVFWYSPSLFGGMWARSYELDMENLQPTPFNYGGAIIVAGVTSWVLGMIIQAINPAHLFDGMRIGFYCWLGFIATSQFSGVIWAKKPLRGYLIDAGCSLITFLLISALFTLWR